jgi:hypothetical protein
MTEPHISDKAVEVMVDALMADAGLPPDGPHRAIVEGRQRLALTTAVESGELVSRAELEELRTNCDSLRLERDGLVRMSRLNNEFLIGQRDALLEAIGRHKKVLAALARKEDATDREVLLESHRADHALYAAADEIRGDENREP